ncbi:DoxX family protein [Pseudomonas palleroniana]|uniref:DoxX family protein n=1 Tax=Pseudomonas palleroniana TaxID=191390 RepID=UPI001FD4BDC1|nr:DoxX family protein [Pseudomonas palleroniana]UOP10319.1 DoxX family protein [Pseudomonas palleroniana]
MAKLQIVGLLRTRNTILGRQRIVRCQYCFGSGMDDYKSASYGVLILRLTAGIALLAHSLYLKVFVFTMSGTSSFFESIGLPGVLAWLVLGVEVTTGALLVLGFKTRYAALAAIPVLLGATWAHSSNGWLFSSTGGGWEYPAFWTAVLIAIALCGDGACSATRQRASDKNAAS